MDTNTINIFKITALDIGGYEEGEIVDFFLTEKNLSEREAVKEWSKEKDESPVFFLGSEINSQDVFQLKEGIDERLNNLREKRNKITQLLSKLNRR